MHSHLEFLTLSYSSMISQSILVSSEEENMEVKKDYTQESELVEEEKPKPENDKMQLLEEGWLSV